VIDRSRACSTRNNTPFAMQSSLGTSRVPRRISNYPAEYGMYRRTSQCDHQVPGSNSFHGSAYEYFRNDRLLTQEFFDFGSRKSELRLNQFGACWAGRSRRINFFSTRTTRLPVRAWDQNIESIPSAAVRGLQACATGRRVDILQVEPQGAATVSTQEFNRCWTFIGPGHSFES